MVTSGSGLPGFASCLPEFSACESDSVEWKNWTTVGVDLSGYIGQTVKIQFTAFDCTPGGHFGYAYISCFCGKLKCTQQCTGTSDILSAPLGFAGYSWTIPPSATVLGTNQNLTITTPVNGTAIYEICTLQSVSGCPYTVYDTLNITPVNFTTTGATICRRTNSNYKRKHWCRVFI